MSVKGEKKPDQIGARRRLNQGIEKSILSNRRYNLSAMNHPTIPSDKNSQELQLNSLDPSNSDLEKGKPKPQSVAASASRIFGD